MENALRPSPGNESAAVAGSGNYAEGQRVAHAKFGVGMVESIKQLGSDHKITVMFDSEGRCTLLTKFAKLVIVR